MDKEVSLEMTPTWAVVTVVVVMVSLGFFFQGSLKRLAKWLDRTKRKALLSALDKIKEELMVFGLLSLLMGHWIVFVAKICVKSSALNSTFYPCVVKKNNLTPGQHVLSRVKYTNDSFVKELVHKQKNEYCPEGHESFVSHESLEQLHRLMFVLGVTHVSYSFIAIALAMIKIYSWRTWENQAKTMALQSVLGSPEAAFDETRQLSTFICHHISHPWSQHRVLVWLLCFSRQFWSSINQADYMALRLGFISKHQLPLTYDFHNYMLRSMEEEFRDIVGISVPLWIYGICCIFLEFHGTDLYFWLSFLPAILILLIGTKLHRVVVKLAVEIMDSFPWLGNRQFNLRDELFWFGKPRLLLWLIQFISFQNAFEMSTFLWSLWEIKESSCFTDNETYIAIRLACGVVTQFWFSFITFPLYVIITQMGAKFKKTVVSENVRKSLHGWQRRVKAKQSSSTPKLLALPSTTSLGFSMTDSKLNTIFSSIGRSFSSVVDKSATLQREEASTSQAVTNGISEDNETLEVSLGSGTPCYGTSSDEDDTGVHDDHWH
ncbi:PREDICTED: MLO-like protein 4 [Populus euphratica]|uniref:MLO-like protein n=1 Tax=Populus euphratica TaxID=75702 RepID=A0AAJ6V8J3_POPEU|nr:PREDICTED: MLO-like protein 4 [Populus euphratica]XP_011043169.1 PREDICTED: MLO-like protein 4 [Populus euphratica]